MMQAAAFNILSCSFVILLLITMQENDWKRRLETLKMMKDKKIGRFRRQGAELRFEDLTIPFGTTLTFENRVFTIDGQNIVRRRY